MRPLEDVLRDLVGRTIVEVETDDDELMLALDDGLVLWMHVDEDGELMMTVSHEDLVPRQ